MEPIGPELGVGQDVRRAAFDFHDLATGRIKPFGIVTDE